MFDNVSRVFSLRDEEKSYVGITASDTNKLAELRANEFEGENDEVIEVNDDITFNDDDFDGIFSDLENADTTPVETK